MERCIRGGRNSFTAGACETGAYRRGGGGQGRAPGGVLSHSGSLTGGAAVTLQRPISAGLEPTVCAGTLVIDRCDNCEVLAVAKAGVKAGDLVVVTVALIVSVLAFDLFPGPAALLTLLVGGAGWVEARRGRPLGRRLLDVFAGMLLAAAVIAALAFVLH